MFSLDNILLWLDIVLIFILIFQEIFSRIRIDVFKMDSGLISFRIYFREQPMWSSIEDEQRIRCVYIGDEDFEDIKVREQSYQEMIHEYEEIATRRMKDILKKLKKYEP